MYILQNLMDSHDTDRLASMIKNPDREFDRDANDGNQKYNPGKPTKDEYHIQKLIAAFQMTYRGAPMIYYGDEVGMWGADDPYDRKPMIWDNLKYDDEVITKSSGFETGYGDYKVEQNKGLLDWYKKVIAIRNNSKALRLGEVKFIYKNDERSSFAFERTYNDEKIVAVFNTGKEKDEFDIQVDSQKILFAELLSGEEGTASGNSEEMAKLFISIPPGKCLIYRVYKQE